MKLAGTGRDCFNLGFPHAIYLHTDDIFSSNFFILADLVIIYL